MATEIGLPTVLAEAVNFLGFNVSSNTKIENDFNHFDSPGFNHPRSVLTNASNGSYVTLTEHLDDVCGQDAVWLHYGNDDSSQFTSVSSGQIRLLMPNDWRYIKKYEATGTVAFRADSLLR